MQTLYSLLQCYAIENKRSRIVHFAGFVKAEISLCVDQDDKMNTKQPMSYSNHPIGDPLEMKDLVSPVEGQRGKEDTAKNDAFGFFLGTVASVGTAVGVGCVQALEGAVPHFEINAMRFFFLLIVTTVMFAIRRQPPTLERKKIVYVAIYAVMINVFSLTLYASVGFLPLGVAGSMIRIIAMLVVLPLAKIILGESITLLKVIAVVIGSIGLVLICKPDTFLGNDPADSSSDLTFNENFYNNGSDTNLSFPKQVRNKTLDNSTTSNSFKVEYMYIGYILAAASAVNSVLHNIFQKKKLPTVDASKLCFWFGISGSVVCTTISAIFENMTLPNDWISWVLILSQCLGFGVMSLCSVYAQQVASSLIVQLSLSLQILFCFIGQYFFLQSIFPTEGSWMEILGAVLSVLGVSLVPAVQLIATKSLPRI